uniref:Uncharacterized protein n=1 Tax=Heterorhabditis bacteriophora TaxID=37862 RepID=A0A1I7X2Z9_HETBA
MLKYPGLPNSVLIDHEINETKSFYAKSDWVCQTTFLYDKDYCRKSIGPKMKRGVARRGFVLRRYKFRNFCLVGPTSSTCYCSGTKCNEDKKAPYWMLKSLLETEESVEYNEEFKHMFPLSQFYKNGPERKRIASCLMNELQMAYKIVENTPSSTSDIILVTETTVQSINNISFTTQMNMPLTRFNVKKNKKNITSSQQTKLFQKWYKKSYMKIYIIIASSVLIILLLILTAIIFVLKKRKITLTKTQKKLRKVDQLKKKVITDAVMVSNVKEGHDNTPKDQITIDPYFAVNLPPINIKNSNIPSEGKGIDGGNVKLTNVSHIDKKKKQIKNKVVDNKKVQRKPLLNKSKKKHRPK